MQLSIKDLKQIFTINSKSPAADESANLSLCIGESYLSYAISGFPGNELYQLEYCSGEEGDGKFLSELFNSQNIFQHSFNKVFVSFDYPQNLLIPDQFQQHTELLLKKNLGMISGRKIISDSFDELNMINVYAVPIDVLGQIEQKFPFFSGSHFFTNSIENYIHSVYSMIKKDSESSMLIDFKSNIFSVTLMQGKNILLAQSYFYSSPKDVIFRLLKIVNHFSQSRDNISVKVSGLIEEDSALFGELFQYFRNLAFRDAIDWRDSISEKSEYHSHYFTSLNDLVRCASLRENMAAEK